MPGPATILGSMTAHGGVVTGPGCPTVLINGRPAIRVGTDMHLCPMVTPVVPPAPHFGMNNVGPGVPNVLIGGQPASTVGDLFLCAGPPAPVIMGATNVLIGTGAVGGGGSGASGQSATTAQMLKAGSIQPIKGTESFPIDIQVSILEVAPKMDQQTLTEIITDLAEAYKEAGEIESEEFQPFTIRDIVNILESMEQEEGFEEAQFFASTLDFSDLSELTRAFMDGSDPNPDNDPNIMPTRFMILYGADDTKLESSDKNSDASQKEEHKNSVKNLRKALALLGYEISKDGPFDDELYVAYMDFIASLSEKKYYAISELEDTPATEKKKLTISVDISKNSPSNKKGQFRLYSTDSQMTYNQTKTISDAISESDNSIKLVFDNVDTTLKYSLEFSNDNTDTKESIIHNKPFSDFLS